jgi:anthranilate phosphoribosyltransferase
VAGKTATLRDGIETARAAIVSGAAHDVLARLVRVSNS